MELILLLWLLFGIIGALIANNKGRSSCGGFALGVLLGPIGVLIVALLSRQEPQASTPAEEPNDVRWRKCPACNALALTVDGKCRACGHKDS